MQRCDNKQALTLEYMARLRAQASEGLPDDTMRNRSSRPGDSCKVIGRVRGENKANDAALPFGEMSLALEDAALDRARATLCTLQQNNLKAKVDEQKKRLQHKQGKSMHA
jgi:hypothetical protein